MSLARVAVADRPCPLRRHDTCRRRRAWLRSIGACEEVGYTAWRDRVLTPVTTIQLFLLPMLHGNTACSHPPHLSGLQFSAVAYCQARAKLPRRLFALLLERFGSAIQRAALRRAVAWSSHVFRRWLGRLHARVRPPYRTPSASRRCSGWGAAFPWHTSWGCSMRALGCS
jgi:hypothetical protein